MKILSKINLLFIVAMLATGVAVAQEQSRLNHGKGVEKRVLSSSAVHPIFGKMPTKINLSSKAEYTTFYRELLLGVKKEGQTEIDIKPITAKAKTSTAEKVKFGSIYPNPATTHADVNYEVLSSFGEAKLTVMNLVGTSLFENTISSNSKKVRINTSGLDSGVYMVQFIVDGKKVDTKKLLVEKN